MAWCIAEQQDFVPISLVWESSRPRGTLTVESPDAREALKIHGHRHGTARELLHHLTQVSDRHQRLFGNRLSQQLHRKVGLDPRGRVERDSVQVGVRCVMSADALHEWHK